MDFPKSARVRTRREFLRFFEGSEVRRLGLCTLFRIRASDEQPRLGITVKARVNSVYRNKLKRQIRESFRLNRMNLLPFDYNVVIPGSVRVDFRTVRKIRKQLESNWAHHGHF
jgi:ribonuclease P protein component